MDTPKTSNTKSPKPNDTTTPEASKPVEVTTKPTDTKTAEPVAEPATPKSAKSANKPATDAREGKRIISVAVPEKLARQLRLLCATTGTTAQAVVEGALRKAINKQLGAALETLKSDLGDG